MVPRAVPGGAHWSVDRAAATLAPALPDDVVDAAGAAADRVGARRCTGGRRTPRPSRRRWRPPLTALDMPVAAAPSTPGPGVRRNRHRGPPSPGAATGSVARHDGRAPDRPGLDHHRRHRRAELRRVRRRRGDHRDHRGQPAQRARHRDAAPGAGERRHVRSSTACPTRPPGSPTAKADGSYTPGRAGRGALPDHRAAASRRRTGCGAMVDTDQISTSADEPGLVIRNEDVFIDKVRERVALAEALGHLLSPVLLLQTGARRRAARRARGRRRRGRRARRDRRRPGRAHPRDLAARPGPARRTSCSPWPAAASWSSPTATTAAWPRRPAACRASSPWSPRPASVAIQPYNRLVSELPVPPTSCSARLPRPARGSSRAAAARGGPGQGHDRAVRRGPAPTR